MSSFTTIFLYPYLFPVKTLFLRAGKGRRIPDFLLVFFNNGHYPEEGSYTLPLVRTSTKKTKMAATVRP